MITGLLYDNDNWFTYDNWFTPLTGLLYDNWFTL